MQDPPILQTKLSLPLLPERLLARFQLQQSLSRHAWRKLLLVVAPAGYGKSTLLAMWLSGSRQRRKTQTQVTGGGRRTAWLSLEDDDDEPHRFMTYLLASLRMAVPGLGEMTEAMLQAGQVDVATLLIPLLNELADCGPLTLVLDDFHVIRDPEIIKMVNFLLDRSSPNLTLAISARIEPALSLARLRAAQKVFEVCITDLRLTSTETADFIRDVAGLHLSDQAISALHLSTEGWLVGVQLATLALRQRFTAEAEPGTSEEIWDGFDGSNDNLIQYFTQEVLSGESEKIKSFILQSSIVDRVHPSLTDAIRQSSDSTQLIEELVARKLFLFPIDSGNHWYRYHALLRQALYKKLTETVPDEEINALHRRASDWYKQRGDRAAALQHVLSAGQPGRAAALVTEWAPELWLSGDLHRLDSWIARLPTDILPDWPQLCLYRAWVRTIDGHYKESEYWLELAERRRRPGNGSPDLNWMMLTWPPLLRFQHNNQAEVAKIAAEFALKQLPDPASAYIVIALLTLGNCAIMLGDAVMAGESLLQAVERAEDLDSAYLLFLAYRNWIQMQLRQAQLDQALESAFRLEHRVAGGRFRLPLQAWAEYSRGEVTLERMQLESAESHFERALELGHQIGDRTLEANCLTRLAWVQELKGRPEAAMNSINASWSLVAERKSDPDSMNIVEAHRAGLALRLGYGAITAAWLARLKPVPSLDRIFMSGAGPTVEINRIHALINGGGESAVDVLARLEDLETVARERVDARLFIEIPALKALVLQSMGRASDAQNSLQQALERAAPQNMKRIFVVLGAQMKELVRAHVAMGPDPFVTEVLAAFDMLNPDREKNGVGFSNSLSVRECQVLRRVAEGLSNQQIANELVVSINTVKTHLKRINAKLNVSNRTSAVARAKELSLL